MANIRIWFEEKARKHNAHPLLVFQDLTVTYGEFNDHINRVANSMLKLGIGPGDKVAIVLPNCPEYLYIWFALAKIKAIAACVNSSFRGDGLQFLVDSCDASLAVVDSSMAPIYNPLRAGLPKIKATIWHPNLPAENNLKGDLSYTRIISEAECHSPPEMEIKESDPWTFLHTSGTTGRPKWCILSHGYYLEQGQTYADSYGFCSTDRIFNPLPLYHANPQVYLVMGSLAANATMILEERFSASAFWNQVRKYRANVAILHMAPLEFLKKQPYQPDEENHSLRFIFPADKEFMKRFKVGLAGGGYGLTEAALVVFQRFRFPLTGKYANLDRIGRLCGKPSPDVDLAILDENDRQLGPGLTGEIALRPRKPNVIFSGYYGRGDKTMESWRNLWFHTGDLGYYDEEGDLHFVRRASESLNVKGEWVDVVGLEDLLRSHPKVMDVAVVGIPDPVEGKRIKACVQPRSGSIIQPEELLDYCQGKIAYYMIPHYIEFLEELPRLGGTEKVAKAFMEKAGITQNTWDREQMGYKIRKI